MRVLTVDVNERRAFDCHRHTGVSCTRSFLVSFCPSYYWLLWLIGADASVDVVVTAATALLRVERDQSAAAIITV